MSIGSVEGTEEQHDVFLSYSRLDRQDAEDLAKDLRALGLSVWMDSSAGIGHGLVSHAIARALAGSKILLGLFTQNYLNSDACQWEWTRFILSAGLDGASAQAVALVTEPRLVNCVHPRNSTVLLSDGDPRNGARIAEIAAAAAPSGVVSESSGTSTVGVAPKRDKHFVGRDELLWEIHYGLADHCGNSGGSVLLHGGCGSGKSTLALEYALRFSPSYPGGVIWLDLKNYPNPRKALARSMAHIASELTGRGGRSLRKNRARIKKFLDEQGQEALWVVDNLAPNVDSDLLDYCQPPSSWAHGLTTSWSRSYGFPIQKWVGPLPLSTALVLLGASARDEDKWASSIAGSLGCIAQSCAAVGRQLANLPSSQPLHDFKKHLHECIVEGAEIDILEGGEHEPFRLSLAKYATHLEGDDWMLLAMIEGAGAAVPRSLLVRATMSARRLERLDDAEFLVSESLRKLQSLNLMQVDSSACPSGLVTTNLIICRMLQRARKLPWGARVFTMIFRNPLIPMHRAKEGLARMFMERATFLLWEEDPPHPDRAALANLIEGYVDPPEQEWECALLIQVAHLHMKQECFVDARRCIMRCLMLGFSNPALQESLDDLCLMDQEFGNWWQEKMRESANEDQDALREKFQKMDEELQQKRSTMFVSPRRRQH